MPRSNYPSLHSGLKFSARGHSLAKSDAGLHRSGQVRTCKISRDSEYGATPGVIVCTVVAATALLKGAPTQQHAVNGTFFYLRGLQSVLYQDTKFWTSVCDPARYAPIQLVRDLRARRSRLQTTTPIRGSYDFTGQRWSIESLLILPQRDESRSQEGRQNREYASKRTASSRENKMLAHGAGTHPSTATGIV